MRPPRQSRYQTQSAIVATFVRHSGSPATAAPAMSFGQSANSTDDVVYAVHYSGTITRLAKGSLQDMSLGVKSLCADMLDQSYIVVGTVAGLAVVNVVENAWWYATSYRGPVPHVVCFDGHIYASFLDGDYVQSNDGRERARAFTVVQIDGQSYKALREIPRLASNGIFDIDAQRRILQVPVLHGFGEQPGSFLYNFLIKNDGELAKQIPTQVHMEIQGISEFKANAFICLEAGILYFIQTGKSIGFEGRINCYTTVPDVVGYIFGLQNGQIVYMDDQLQGYVIANQSALNEVTAITQSVELGRTIVVAYGSFQDIDDIRASSEIQIAHFTRNYTTGVLSLAEF